MAKNDLTEDRNTRVKLTMIPDHNSNSITKENMNSPTHLLAATFSYKILKKFADCTTQRELQERFHVRPKQLVAYITE